MKTILFVEDDTFLIDIYKTKLKEAGFNLEVAMEGQEALRKIAEHNLGKETIWPDLLVLDIVLPHLNGWEVLEKIKADEKLKNMKVLVLSNFSQKSEVEKGLSFGVTKYLIKAHYTPSEVLQEIKKILENYKEK